MTVEINLDAYDSLEHALEEKRFWMQVKCLFDHCTRTTGVEPEDVASFAYRVDYLTAEELSSSDISYGSRSHHNAVRVKGTNDMLPMPMFPRPIMPDWMNVSIKEIS